MVDALSRLPNQAKSIGVPDQITNVHMFTLQPKLLQSVYDYLLKEMMLERFTISQKQYLAQRANLLQNVILYIFGQDNRFCHVLQPKDVPTILQELHSGVGGG